jgi:hypothetical protein
MNVRMLRTCSLIAMTVSMVSLVYAQGGALRFPESRSYSPGKVWLGWSSAERTGFVRGFIIGENDGFRRACAISQASELRQATGDDPCLKEQHLFHKDLPYYEKFVTDFYNEYSTDRDVPVRVLVVSADDKTPAQVHQWLAAKGE